MSNIIDRILSGDFDEDNESAQAVSKPSTNGSTTPEHVSVEDEEDSDFEDLCISADETDCGDQEPVQDVPSDAWVKRHCKKNGIELAEMAMAGPAPTQYIEKPKQSKFTTTKQFEPAAAPKQSTTDSSEAVKKKGAPYKLLEHVDEIVRLYTSGVSTKGIAEKYSVSVSCIIGTLKRNNVTIRAKGRQKSQIN